MKPILIVDDEASIAELIRRTLAGAGYDCAAVTDGAAAADLLEREAFDLVLLDPPYAAGLLEPAIARLTAFDILNPHGIIVAEHPADRALPPVEPPYRVRRTYRYGKIGLTLICRSGDQENEE